MADAEKDEFLLDSHDIKAVGELMRDSKIRDFTRIFNLAAQITAESLRQIGYGRPLRIYNSQLDTSWLRYANIVPVRVRNQVLTRLTDEKRYSTGATFHPVTRALLSTIQQTMKLDSTRDALRFSLAFTAAVNGALHSYSGKTRLAFGDSWDDCRLLQLPIEKSMRASFQRAGNRFGNTLDAVARTAGKLFDGHKTPAPS